MARRILSVWLPHWPITRLRRPPIANRPLVTVETVRGQRVLTDAAMEADGLQPGQTLAHARALWPGLIALEADPDGDRAALTSLAAWAERFTPLATVDTECDHGLWLDITGCAHLFRGSVARAENTNQEAVLLADFRARLARHGIPARMAIAGTTGAAWALARTAERDDTIIAAGEERAALASLPIAALRLDDHTIAKLRHLGVRTVENLAHLPREEVTARFGPMPVLRLDQAFGGVTEAITWPHPPAPFLATLPFAEPIGTAEDLSRALSKLTEELCAQLTAAGQGGLQFTAQFFRVDNLAQDIAIATARPVREPAYVAKLLGMKLETVDPGFGVEAITLATAEVALLSAVQAEAFAVADELDGLAAVVDRLSNDIGPKNIWRPAPFASHVPERAVVRVPVIQPAIQKAAMWERDPSQPRPIRLLRRPEPIEVTAPVPDDPPVLFRWRRSLHRVRTATGPERIAHEWWRERERQRSASDQTNHQERQRSASDQNQSRPETDLIRDYYQVEDTDGARFWVFRAGLHGGGQTPRWYLHGLFG